MADVYFLQRGMEELANLPGPCGSHRRYGSRPAATIRGTNRPCFGKAGPGVRERASGETMGREDTRPCAVASANSRPLSAGAIVVYGARPQRRPGFLR